MFKNTFVLFFIAIIFAGVSFIAIKKRSTPSTSTLTIGMMSGWAPFMTVNANGTLEGFDVDVAQKVAAKLGKKLEIKDFGSLATLLVALQQNKINFAMSGLDITQSRLEIMDMIPYTGEAITSFYLLFWRQIPKTIASIEDLQKLKEPVICAEPGSAQAKYLDQFKFIKQKSLSKLEDMVLDVKYGKSIALIVEPHIANRLLNKTQELKKMELAIPKNFQTYGMGIAFMKKNPDFNKIKQIIEELRKNGITKQLEKKWNLGQE